MLLDIKRLFGHGELPVHTQETLDLSGEDFPGYTVNDAVCVAVDAVPAGGVVELRITVQAVIHYECARCLEPSQQAFTAEKSYTIRQADLADPDAELPFTADGKLDTRELAYTELVLEVPSALLCSDDCAGLCPVCGGRKPCACTHETSGEVDERLSILKQLLS
jgi:uncharacterized protein